MSGQTIPRNLIPGDVIAQWEETRALLGLPASVRFVIVEKRFEAHSPGGTNLPPVLRFFWTGRKWEQVV